MRKNLLMGVCLISALSLPSAVQAKDFSLNNIPENSIKTPGITGVVTDAKGEALPGVVVQATESKQTAVTDADGRFTLDAKNGERLRFSYLGYTTKDDNAKPNMKVSMQDDTHVLNEVVVTTQKRQQSAVEVPIAVSAVTGNVLGKLGMSQMDEMATMTPGVQIQLQSPNNPGYVIRGVTSDDGESTSQPRVSVFTDGVSTSRSRASVSELFDMERIEVAKGPQGTLFGRGAEIGGISLIRNKAKDNLSGELGVRYGAYNTRQVTGFINTPIIKSKLANRFAFDYDARDGFIKNLAGGRLNGKEALAFRNSTAWWSDNTSVNLVLDYQHDNYPGTSFRTEFPDFGVSQDPNDPANLDMGKGLYIHRNVGGGTLLVDHDFNDNWKLSSITGVRAFNSDEKFDADGTYLPLLNAEEKAKGTQISQEFRFNYDNHRNFSGFAGMSYFFEDNSQDVLLHSDLKYLYPVMMKSKMKSTFTGLFSTVKSVVMSKVPAAMQSMVGAQFDAAQKQLMSKWFPESGTQNATPDFYGDLNTLFQQFGALLGMKGVTLDQFLASLGDKGTTYSTLLKNLSNQTLSTYSEEGKNYNTTNAAEVYADGTWKLYKGLNFTLGMRGTYEHQKSSYSSVDDQNAFLATALASNGGHVIYTPSAKVSASKDYWSWVGRAVLNYLFSHNNAYLSVSRGRRPGVLYYNNSPEKLSTLKPEIIYSYEAGLKGLIFGNHLRYDLSVYYYDWYHFQTNRFDQEQSMYIASDAGRAHSFGVEASLTWSPIRELTFFGNYSYIDGKFNDKDENGNKQEYAGNRFRLTPKNSFTIGADVELSLSKKSTIFFRPTYTYKSKVYFEDDNKPAQTAYGTYDLTQKGYGLCNFNLGWHCQPAKVYYEIGVFGKNIFDQKYIVDAGNSGRNIGFPTFIGGTRSVIGVQAKIGF